MYCVVFLAHFGSPQESRKLRVGSTVTETTVTTVYGEGKNTPALGPPDYRMETPATPRKGYKVHVTLREKTRRRTLFFES